MPSTTVTAPPPRPATTAVAGSTGTLVEQVNTRGLCTRARIDSQNDPWFPATKVREALEVRARRACAGCPVIAECLELTLRIEGGFNDLPSKVNGIFGGRAPHERIEMILARRGGAR